MEVPQKFQTLGEPSMAAGPSTRVSYTPSSLSTSVCRATDYGVPLKSTILRRLCPPPSEIPRHHGYRQYWSTLRPRWQQPGGKLRPTNFSLCDFPRRVVCSSVWLRLLILSTPPYPFPTSPRPVSDLGAFFAFFG